MRIGACIGRTGRQQNNSMSHELEVLTWFCISHPLPAVALVAAFWDPDTPAVALAGRRPASEPRRLVRPTPSRKTWHRRLNKRLVTSRVNGVGIDHEPSTLALRARQQPAPVTTGVTHRVHPALRADADILDRVVSTLTNWATETVESSTAVAET